MNQWIKCTMMLTIITGIIFFSGMEDEFFAWGDDNISDPDPENLNITIFHGGENGEQVADDNEDDLGTGAFTFGYLKDPDADTPYAFELMKLIVCKPPQKAIDENQQTEVKLTLNAGKDGKAIFLDQARNELGTECAFLPEKLPPEMWIKVTKPSARWKDITICASFLEECEDTVKATAVAIDGKFRIIGDQNAPYYHHEEPLVGVTEEDETFFRTLGGMRLHLKATLPPDDVEEYAWGITGGEFFQNYSTTAQPLGPAACKGADLKEIYWQGAYRPDLDETITLKLKIKGMEEFREITRTIKSRVLREGMQGDDVTMLQAYLRQMGVSHSPRTGNCSTQWCRDNCRYGHRGTLIAVTGSFDAQSKTKEAVKRMQNRDEISPDGVPGQQMLSKIQLHWPDYLKAFEAYPDFPFIKPPNPNPKAIQQAYNIWLQGGAEELADTYSDEFVMKVDPEHAFYTPADPFTCFGCNESRERLLDAWINKEASKGHWGYNKNIPFRIVLGECDNRGSIGFSQIQNRFRYGVDVADEFKDVNLYHPGDNARGFAIWSNSSDGDMGRGFYLAFNTNQYVLPTPSNTYPRLIASYFSDEPLNKKKREESEATDTLSKGLSAYKEGHRVGSGMLYNDSWPEILRRNPKVGDVDTSIEKAIAYPLTIRSNAGLLVNRTWTWEVKVITVGPDGKCQTLKEGDDEQVLNVGDESEPHAVAIIGGIPGGNETLDTRIKVCFTEAEYDAFLNQYSLGKEKIEAFVIRSENQVCFDIWEISPEERAALGDDAVNELLGKNDDQIEVINITYGEEDWLEGRSWIEEVKKAKGGN